MKTLLLSLFLTLALASQAFALTANLSWTDNSNNEDGFIVQTSMDASFATGVTILGSVGANVTALSDPTTTAGKCYRVHAFNLIGPSGFSGVACVGGVPSAPGGLVIVVTP